MSTQCKLPCLPPPACKAEAAHTDTRSSHCSTVDLDVCSLQDIHPCPEQTSQVDPCLCQSAATCMDSSPQVGSTCPPPAVPTPGDTCCPEHKPAWDSCASTCTGAVACPAVISCDSPQSKGGANFPLQPTALSVEPCAPETVKTCVETFPMQHPVSAMDPCTLQTDGTCVKTFPFQHVIPTVELCAPELTGTCVENFPHQQPISPVEPCIPQAVGTCMENIPLEHSVSAMEPCTLKMPEPPTEEPCCPQEVIIGDPCFNQPSATRVDPCVSPSVVCVEPCVPQSTTQPTETCTPQSTAGSGDTSSSKDTAEGASACPSPPAPFRLNTRTAAIVERCLSRCQNWLRGKK